MRIFATFAVLSGLSLSSVTASAEPLQITTFNIEFYGNRAITTPPNSQRINTPIQDTQEDRRNPTIQEFLTLANIDPDLFAFQEIVDKNTLKTSLLKNKYECHSYDHNRSHQFVVICHKKHLSFRKGNNDNNMIWEDVAMGSLRPAVHGILSLKGGRDLAHIVALHLKAMPDQSTRRLAQADLLARNVRDRGDNLPVVVLGDLNTYESDIENITELFQNQGIDIQAVDGSYEYTYRSDRYRNKLDWIMVTSNAEVLEETRVDGPCNTTWRSDTRYDNLSFYNTNVSDHCPLTTVIDF